MSTAAASVSLPWGAWYADGEHALDLPPRWSVDVLEPAPEAALDAAAIARALGDPIGTPPLRVLAAGRRRAVIVIDDLARPTPVGDLLPPVLRQLREGGLDESAVTILVATGLHRRPSEAEMRRKLGSAFSPSLRVVAHDPAGDLVDTGVTYGAGTLRLNRTFVDADLRVAIGSVLPHSFAGYGGGAKAIIPGLTDVTATARSHKFVQMGLAGGADLDRNRFRLEIERLVASIGLDQVVCAVPNGRMQSVGVYAGEITRAHRAACAHAARSYATPVRRSYDALIVNAYPKDVDLVQAPSALSCLRGLAAPAVRPGGVVVLTSATSQGAGEHGLFSPGGVSYRAPRPLPRVETLALYMPNVDRAEVHRQFWPEYPVLTEPAALRRFLESRLPADAAVGVVPCAPVQQLVDDRAR